jgi:predicted  nucleic acid-binding Zn-ribbon protein
MKSSKRAIGFKKLACKKCGNLVEKVDEKVEAITCSTCVQADLRGYPDISAEEWFRLDAERRAKAEADAAAAEVSEQAE